MSTLHAYDSDELQAKEELAGRTQRKAVIEALVKRRADEDAAKLEANRSRITGTMIRDYWKTHCPSHLTQEEWAAQVLAYEDGSGSHASNASLHNLSYADSTDLGDNTSSRTLGDVAFPVSAGNRGGAGGEEEKWLSLWETGAARSVEEEWYSF